MDMHVLSELGRWLLEEPGWKAAWGRGLWSEAFEACGSPTDWVAFQRARGEDSRLVPLWEKYRELVEAEARQGPPGRSAVILPDF